MQLDQYFCPQFLNKTDIFPFFFFSLNNGQHKAEIIIRLKRCTSTKCFRPMTSLFDEGRIIWLVPDISWCQSGFSFYWIKSHSERVLHTKLVNTFQQETEIVWEHTHSMILISFFYSLYFSEMLFSFFFPPRVEHFMTSNLSGQMERKVCYRKATGKQWKITSRVKNTSRQKGREMGGWVGTGVGFKVWEKLIFRRTGCTTQSCSTLTREVQPVWFTANQSL